ncbi:MAG: tetratricopeptide repeat protein, partial [Octadecabacter sp.]
EKGNARAASRVITKAWGVAPHPDLSAAFAAVAPEETPAARIKRFRALTKTHPEHPETKMMLAELHIAAEDFPEARRTITELVATDPTARSLTIMAAIERGEGSADAVVRGWLAKALTAPRGPQWICDNCQHIHSVWTPVCDNCSSFDTLAWREPPKGEVAMPAGVEMLPLIVGQIEAPKDDVDAEIVEAEIIDEDAVEVVETEETK